jgi:hypothetical protein
MTGLALQKTDLLTQSAIFSLAVHPVAYFGQLSRKVLKWDAFSPNPARRSSSFRSYGPGE